MSAWREAMDADILAFFDIDDPDTEVIDIDIEQEDRGTCPTCRWTVFIVEVSVSTRYGAQRKRYEGSITEFLNAVGEAAEARTTTAQDDDHPAWVYG